MGYVYTDNAKLRAPDDDAGDDVPADLSYVLAQLDTAVILQAPTKGDRDNLYLQAPSGVVCLVRAASAPHTLTGLYIKTSDAGSAVWGVIWEPASAFSLTAIQLSDSYTSRGTPQYDPGVWLEPGGYFASCHGAVVRVDGNKCTNGDIIGYLPTNFLPLYPSNDYACATAYSSGTGNGTAKVSIQVDGSLQYFGPDVAWIGLDSIRFFVTQS